MRIHSNYAARQPHHRRNKRRSVNKTKIPYKKPVYDKWQKALQILTCIGKTVAIPIVVALLLHKLELR